MGETFFTPSNPTSYSHRSLVVQGRYYKFQGTLKAYLGASLTEVNRLIGDMVMVILWNCILYRVKKLQPYIHVVIDNIKIAFIKINETYSLLKRMFYNKLYFHSTIIHKTKKNSFFLKLNIRLAKLYYKKFI